MSIDAVYDYQPHINHIQPHTNHIPNHISTTCQISNFPILVTILEHPLARPILPHLPPALNNIAQSENARVVIDEYDSGRVYLAKWAARVAEEAESQNDKTWVPLYKPVGVEEGGSVHFEEDTELGPFEILSVSVLSVRCICFECLVDGSFFRGRVLPYHGRIAIEFDSIFYYRFDHGMFLCVFTNTTVIEFRVDWSALIISL